MLQRGGLCPVLQNWNGDWIFYGELWYSWQLKQGKHHKALSCDSLNLPELIKQENVFLMGWCWIGTLRKVQQILYNVVSHTSASSSFTVPSGFFIVLAKRRIFTNEYSTGWQNPGKCLNKSAQILQRHFAFLDFVFLLIFSISMYHGKEIRLEKTFTLPVWKTPEMPIMPLA